MAWPQDTPQVPTVTLNGVGRHPWIEVGGRRWCTYCGCYQIRRSGKWQDDPNMIGMWPAYRPTPQVCAIELKL